MVIGEEYPGRPISTMKKLGGKDDTMTIRMFSIRGRIG